MVSLGLYLFTYWVVFGMYRYDMSIDVIVWKGWGFVGWYD